MVVFGRKGFLKHYFGAFFAASAFFLVVNSVEAKDAWKTKFLKPSYTSILVDAHSGKVLYSDHSRKKVHPSSLTKIMALYEVFRAIEKKEISMDSTIVVSQNAANQPPCKLNLRSGQRVRVRDMILGCVTKSGNDAMVVLAEAVAGSESSFAQRMNGSARRLGMMDTHFANVSGLPNPDQVTTAYDMALLSRAFIKHFPNQYRVFATKHFAYGGVVYNNHNRLVGQTIEAHGKKPIVDGIKTGFTCASGFNLAASAVHGDKRVIAVVMGGPNPQWRNQRIEQLLSFGFSKELHPEANIRLASAVVPSAAAVTALGQDLTENLTDEESGALVMSASASADQPFVAPQQKKENITHVMTQEGRGWSIQTGVFRHPKEADAHLKKVLNIAQIHLVGGKTSTVQVGGKGKKKKLHKVRIANLTQRQAKQSCQVLHKKGVPCVSVS